MIYSCEMRLGKEIEADTATVVTVSADKIWSSIHEEIYNNGLRCKHHTQGQETPFVLHDDIILIIHLWEMQPDVVVFRVKATLISVWLPFLSCQHQRWCISWK